MAEHPIQNLMNVTMDKIRQMVDSNTIVGKPITTDDGTTILPVSKVSFGFASAGTDFDGKPPIRICSAAAPARVSTSSPWHSWWSRMAVFAPSSSLTATTLWTAP